MKKRRTYLILALIVVLMLTASIASAATTITSTSVKQLSEMTEEQLLALMELGCTDITHEGKNVGMLCPADASGSESTSTGTPDSTSTVAPGATSTFTPNPDASKPSDLLDLQNWYLGLPINTEHDGDPDNIYQPELTGYENRPYFFLNETKDGVVFAAHAGGDTTGNSSYPRSELRERNGEEMAAWSNESGTHTMEIRQAITKTTPVKPHVVAGQIHDGNDDVIQIKLVDKELAVYYNDGESKIVLDPAYQLGAIFDVKVDASNSRIQVSYNGEQKANIDKSGSSWYFKAGCYIQSNTSKGDAADAFGEVIIYALTVTHSGSSNGSPDDSSDDEPSTATPTVPSTANGASPSGQPMPVGDLPGWKQVFTEDFTSNVPIGSFPGEIYKEKFRVYQDGWPDTAGKAGEPSRYYPSKVVSVNNGLLDKHLRTEDGTPMGAAILPLLPDQLYGKYTIRFRSDPLKGFKTAWLLWPESESRPRDGEIDFPEGDLAGTIGAFMHHTDASSGGDQDAFDTTTTYTDWHTASIEWTEGKVVFILDDKVIGTSTERIPNTPMHWVIQTESCLSSCPSSSTNGHLQIDWVTLYAPA